MKGYIVSALVVLSSACTAGNHQLTTESRTLNGFTRVENASNVAVTIAEGGPSAVAVTIDSNLSDALRTELQGDTLIISSEGWIVPSAGAEVRVHLPQLDEVKANGSGAVTASGASNTHDLTLENTGSAKLTWDGQAAHLTVRTSGSGSTQLSGSASTLETTNTGSGQVDAQACPATDATLSSTGSGDTVATVNDGTVAFTLSGSGSIEWSGTARVASSTRTGSGSIVHR